jgi:hypothetical protein
VLRRFQSGSIEGFDKFNRVFKTLYRKILFIIDILPAKSDLINYILGSLSLLHTIRFSAIRASARHAFLLGLVIALSALEFHITSAE